MRILLIEDTRDVGEAIVAGLERVGHAVDWELDGAGATEIVRGTAYDLIILDVMLPGVDGFTILQRMRSEGATTPVLVLTARSRVEDRVDALDLGADDYLVKPFDFRELEARCRALLRRPLGQAASSVAYGNLTFDAAARRVSVAGQAVELGAREFRLLELLLANLDRVLSKDALLDQLLGLEEAVAPNAIELYVSRLRRKLEGSSVRIRTLRGLGYVAELDAPR